MNESSSCGCGCGSGSNTNEVLTITPTENNMRQNQTTLKINGMTCGHCVASVTKELEGIPGVSHVEVDLSAGGTSTAIITTSTSIDHSLLTGAVAEAGYTVVSTGV